MSENDTDIFVPEAVWVSETDTDPSYDYRGSSRRPELLGVTGTSHLLLRLRR